MRSYLLKSMASVFAMLAALAFVAGGAMAQEMSGPKISGGAAVGWGLVSWDTGRTSAQGAPSSGDSFNTQIESNVIVSGTNGSMDYYFRIRARGTQGDTVVKGESEGTFTDNQLQTVRARVGWNASDALRLEIGKLPGIGGTGFADRRPVRAPGSFRHFVNNIAMFDSGALNVSFKTGGIRAGVAISTDCQVDCSGGLGGGDISLEFDPTTGDVNIAGVDATSVGNANTILPYVQASFGALKIGFRYAASSADVAGVTYADDGTGSLLSTTVYDGSVSSTGMVLEADFVAGPADIGFEYTGTTEGCIDSVTGSGCKDFNNTSIAVAVTFQALLFQLSTSSDDDGLPAASTKGKDKQVLSVAYLADVGGGKIGPEITSVTETPQVTGGKDSTGTLVRLVMTTGF